MHAEVTISALRSAVAQVVQQDRVGELTQSRCPAAGNHDDVGFRDLIQRGGRGHMNGGIGRDGVEVLGDHYDMVSGLDSERCLDHSLDADPRIMPMRGSWSRRVVGIGAGWLNCVAARCVYRGDPGSRDRRLDPGSRDRRLDIEPGLM